jgi:hypothetical protein
MIDSAKSRMITEQGNFVGRPGFSTIDHTIEKTDALSVTTHAAHVFSTQVEL